MSTQLGQLVGGLFGLQAPDAGAGGAKNNESCAKNDPLAGNPLTALQRIMPGSFKPEIIDDRFTHLYISTPRVYVASDEYLFECIEKLANTTAKNELNKVYAAYQDEKDYSTTLEAVRAVGQLRGASDSTIAEFLDVMALLACTSSIDLVSGDVEPMALWTAGSIQDNAEAEVAFFRYLNNWLAEDRGMRDARKTPDLYLQAIRQKIFSKDPQTRLGACRAHYTISRCLTSKNLKDTSAVSFLLGALGELMDAAKGGDKQVMACANLLSGALGRCLLTLKARDEGLFKVGRAQA